MRLPRRLQQRPLKKVWLEAWVRSITKSKTSFLWICGTTIQELTLDCCPPLRSPAYPILFILYTELVRERNYKTKFSHVYGKAILNTGHVLASGTNLLTREVKPWVKWNEQYALTLDLEEVKF